MSHLQQSLGDQEALELRSQSSDDEMDLTPMVDVTFLLLIFFMITAAFAVQKALEVPPMNDDAQSQPLDTLEDDSVVVRIDADNVFWIGAPLWAEEQRTPSIPEMLSKVREARGSGSDGPTKLLVQAMATRVTSSSSRHSMPALASAWKRSN